MVTVIFQINTLGAELQNIPFSFVIATMITLIIGPKKHFLFAYNFLYFAYDLKFQLCSNFDNKTDCDCYCLNFWTSFYA